MLPSIRSKSVWDTNWPRTLHDGLATGFSPLPCNMKTAPGIFSEIPTTGSLNWVYPLTYSSINNDLKQGVLIDDGELRLVDSAGHIEWTHPSIGSLIATGDFMGNGHHYALAGAANVLTLFDLKQGQTCWRQDFEPVYVGISGKVADILPDHPGQEALIVPNYDTQAYLLSLVPDQKPEILWQQPVVDEGEFDERSDHHGGTFELGLS
ncbi:MAG: hypothetical protein FJ267_07750, partial [Planctomycetes bacterium]|nr:hypothetical protein [Planctomycetota bacterium]